MATGRIGSSGHDAPRRRAASLVDGILRLAMVAVTFLAVGAVAPLVATAAPAPPGRLHVAGGHLVDGAGRTVTLHGYVTVTNLTDAAHTAVTYTAGDYRRMAKLGVDYQSIRVDAAALGAWPGLAPQPGYVDRVASMVQLAAQAGIASSFKLTFYNVPSCGTTFGCSPAMWDSLWNDAATQDALITGYARLWGRFGGDPNVIGFDLLNEPQEGSSTLSPTAFTADDLNPLYQRMIDAMRRVAPASIAFFQPLGSGVYPAVLGRTNVVYAPHFYPNLLGWLVFESLSTAQYASTIQQYVADASSNGAALVLGEAGMPFLSVLGPLAYYEARYTQLEEAMGAVVDASTSGVSRAWWADDRAAGQGGGGGLTSLADWAVLDGNSGTNLTAEPDRTWITTPDARPYATAVAGNAVTQRFDPATRRFTLHYIATGGPAPTEVAIAASRTYPTGFQVTDGAGTTWSPDPSCPSGLRRAAPTSNGLALRWNAATHRLTVAGADPGAAVVLTVAPTAQLPPPTADCA